MAVRALRRLLLLSALPALTACAASADLTPEQEYYAGRAFSANVLHQYKRLVPDPTLNEYVYKVGTLLALSSERAETHLGPFRSYHFAVLDVDEMNAFAAPSGFVFITRGLLKKCENEDELAAVLAHEISHVVLRHPEDAAATAKRHADAQKVMGWIGAGIAAYGKAAGDEKIQKWGGTVGQFAEAMDEIFDVVQKGYDRKQEYAADRGGVALAAGVGYDPGAMKRMLDRLGDRKKGVLGWVGDTHPTPRERVAEIDKVAALRQAEGKPLRGHVEEVRTARFRAATAGLK